MPAGKTQKQQSTGIRSEGCLCFEQDDKPGYVLDDHLSRPSVARRLKRPTWDWRAACGFLRAPVRPCFGWGLHVPHLLPDARWSLTPPFQPYREKSRRYISVALAWESPPPDVIRHPALCSPDFPRKSPHAIICAAQLSQ